MITALFNIPGFYSFAEKSILKAAGVKTLEAFKAKYGDKNFSQAGQAGAVPAPDSAPMTGAPHEDANNAPAAGGMAEQATEAMRDGHGSNGTSYDNSQR